MTFRLFNVTISLMQARILNPAEEHLWADFVRNHPLGNIHQIPEWGHFQAKIPGRGKYWIVVIEENLTVDGQARPQILAGTLLIRHQLPKGYCWLYAPRGPLLDYNSKDNYAAAKNQMDALLPEIKKIAKHEKTIFLRIDPLIQISQICARAQILHQKTASESHSISSHAQPLLHFPHFRQNIHGFQPDNTLILDLSKSEEELLKQMKPKGRYNIKLAEKKGVKIHTAGYLNSNATNKSTIQNTFNPSQFEKDLAAFYGILTETASRDGFHGHDLQFYKNMLESLSNFATLYLAEYNNQIVAACLNAFYKDTTTYYYGASSNTWRNIMAPYLLHWQAIKDAKQKGHKFYDFFGISPTDLSTGTHLTSHQWAGVTEFKKKFGGTEISYQKPQELPFKKSLYILYRAYKKLR